MTKTLPKVDLQPLHMQDLEFLPIGTPVISEDSSVIQFLFAVQFETRCRRGAGKKASKSERWITDIEFKTGFGTPEDEHRALSSVTSYHIRNDRYKVIVSPKLEELERFYTEGHEYWESLPTPEDGIRDRLFLHSEDNPYNKRSPMGMAWYEGFLDARGGRPNPFRKE